MAITYTEKGGGLHKKLAELGYSLREENRVWKSNNDAEVQLIINSYDQLPDIKKSMVYEIKANGLARINAIFPAISSVDEVEFYAEFWLSIVPAARSATVNFQKIINIHNAAKTAIASVNGAANAAGVSAVTVSWPV